MLHVLRVIIHWIYFNNDTAYDKCQTYVSINANILNKAATNQDCIANFETSLVTCFSRGSRFNPSIEFSIDNNNEECVECRVQRCMTKIILRTREQRTLETLESSSMDALTLNVHFYLQRLRILTEKSDLKHEHRIKLIPPIGCITNES